MRTKQVPQEVLVTVCDKCRRETEDRYTLMRPAFGLSPKVSASRDFCSIECTFLWLSRPGDRESAEWWAGE